MRTLLPRVLCAAALVLACARGTSAAPLAPDSVDATRPEPAGWFIGDMHVHRSCGGSPVTVSSLYNAMVAADFDLISLCADMGNGEVQNATTDLPLVTGADASQSTGTRKIHWDTEWHWDAIYTQYPHQALGGHVMCLGLTNAHQIWDEMPAHIMDWAHAQGGIAGFAHFEYLDDGFPQTLSCCTPIEYPVETALGNADFVSEDVTGGESFIHAYYRLLNCGFRPGFCAGSDNPCGASVGLMATYGRTATGTLSYRGWLDAIARGRTVVSRVGRTQFLDLRVDGTARPGDTLAALPGDTLHVVARWTTESTLSRTIQVVCNGLVVASHDATASPGAPDSLVLDLPIERSSWVCARVMNGSGHDVHTAAVFATVLGARVRASVEDADFYVRWCDALLANTSPGGPWSSFFPTERAAAQARYSAARAVFAQIEAEAATSGPQTLFAPGMTPVEQNENDGQPLEVGVRFAASTDGWITGLRFWKSASNTGEHIGHLWTAAGAPLAQVTFPDGREFGWQQAIFDAPVPIQADSVYVASYHSPSGYSDTVDFLGSGYANGPLRALADGEAGGNGLYRYTAAPAFPTESWSATNYWVDVLFAPASTAGVGGRGAGVPRLVVMPNPARGALRLAFDAPAGGHGAVEILDVAGRHVRTLVGAGPAGPVSLAWDGRDASGTTARAGLYFARVHTPRGVVTARFVLAP